MKQTPLKERRAQQKASKENKRFSRDFKNGLIESGLTAKGWALFHEIDGNESAFDLSGTIGGDLQ